MLTSLAHHSLCRQEASVVSVSACKATLSASRPDEPCLRACVFQSATPRRRRNKLREFVWWHYPLCRFLVQRVSPRPVGIQTTWKKSKDHNSLSANEQVCEKEFAPNMSRIAMSSLCACKQLQDWTRNKDFWWRPPVFPLNAPQSFHGHCFRSSPVGLGIFTCLAQATDSLFGFHLFTPPLGHNMLCNVAAQLFSQDKCWPKTRHSWSPAVNLLFDVKFHIRHVLHHNLAVHRLCQWIRWGCLLVLTFFTVNLPSFTSRCIQKYCTSMSPSSEGLDDVLC